MHIFQIFYNIKYLLQIQITLHTLFSNMLYSINVS